MRDFEQIVPAIRGLQRLGASPGLPAASAAELAREECLARADVDSLLARLEQAGLVRAAGSGRFRLVRPASEIRVGDVWGAFGAGRPNGANGRVTIAELLSWETGVFDGDSVAQAA